MSSFASYDESATASALPMSTPTLLRDFDPMLDELKSGSDFEANKTTTTPFSSSATENFYIAVPLDTNRDSSSSTTATPSPEPPSEPPPPLPQSGMNF